MSIFALSFDHDGPVFVGHKHVATGGKDLPSRAPSTVQRHLGNLQQYDCRYRSDHLDREKTAQKYRFGFIAVINLKLSGEGRYLR